MAYTPREIKDRVAVGDDIFIVEDLGNNRIRLIPAPTHVSEAGTPINKALLQPIEDYLATGVVPAERTITAGTGLIGGGSLDADRTLSVNFGTTAGTVCEGNDYRLSNARTPTAHNHAAGDLPSIYTLLDHFINSGEIGEIEARQIAGIKNSLYRGKNLGTSYTPEQQSQVASGKFLDLWVGDYWVINGTRYYIAAFNYYLNTDTSPLALTTNHITLVPAESMYSHRMNSTLTTEGGYVGSEMYTTGLDQAKTKIHADFAGHVVNHRRYLSNAVSDGQASAGAWFDSDVELMNEVMVFGSVVNGKGTRGAINIGTEKSQLPLFALRPDLLNTRSAWWLRDVCSATRFAIVSLEGVVGLGFPGSASGVRPVFSISA
jgi:hypothetical protein